MDATKAPDAEDDSVMNDAAMLDVRNAGAECRDHPGFGGPSGFRCS
jgi:hypothetical protein